MQLNEDQIHERSSVGHCISVQSRQDMEKCPEHMTTLLVQTLCVCTSPGQEGQVWQMLTAYANIFSSCKADIGRTRLVEHCNPVDPGTGPIRQPRLKLSPQKG